MIKELTPEQEAQIDVYRDKWLNIGLSTEPVDLEKAKAAITKLYEVRGFKAPTEFKFVNGFNSTTKEEFPLGSIWVGNLSAYWIGFYEYFNDMFGICPEIEPVAEVAKACGSVHFEEDRVIIVDRPETIKMMDGVLHCEDGPAIRYRDGFEVYSWRGTRVPKEFIMDKENVDPMLAINHENVEQRRALAEILGWDTILGLLDTKIVDEDDPEIGTLVEVNIPDIGVERFIRVLCGTTRQFALPVPPETKTALEAQAFLHGMKPEEFMLPEIRT